MRAAEGGGGCLGISSEGVGSRVGGDGGGAVMRAPVRLRIVRALLVRAVVAETAAVRRALALQARDHLVALHATARAPHRVAEYAEHAETLALLLRAQGASGGQSPRRTTSTLPPALVSTTRMAVVRVEPDDADPVDRAWWPRDTAPMGCIPPPPCPGVVEPPRPPAPVRRRLARVVEPPPRPVEAADG